ncbi:MAG: NAD(P)/FAD-dependent oxidoreductase [Chloroflexota bacterium]
MIAVIGGGIAGLTAALELSSHGERVVVYEAAPGLGGQAGTFEVEGARLERFYHHLFTADLDMIDLVRQLGIQDRLLWVQPRMGLFHAGQVRQFGTIGSLLALPYLSLADKLRFGVVTLFLMRLNRYQVFEGVPAWDWMRGAAGPNLFDVVWGPLLEAKFSRYAHDASMVWLWGKLALRGASRRSGKELLGYFNLSFQVLIDALGQRLRRQGVELHTSSPVEEVRPEADGRLVVRLEGRERTFDRVILALHNRDVPRLAPSLPGSYRADLGRITYEAACCLVLSLHHPLSNIYWMNISDPTLPFTAIVEHTNFMPPERYNGRHIVYLSRYMPPDDPLLSLSKEDLLATYQPHLVKVQPRFRPDWVHQSWLFKDSQAQPIITTNYGRLRPPFTTPIPNLYLANTTQIYPEDRGTNYAARLGRQVAALLLGRSAATSYVPMIGTGRKPEAFIVR